MTEEYEEYFIKRNTFMKAKTGETGRVVFQDRFYVDLEVSRGVELSFQRDQISSEQITEEEKFGLFLAIYL